MLFYLPFQFTRSWLSVIVMRVSIVIVNWEISCCQQVIAFRMRIQAIATQFCPCGLLGVTLQLFSFSSSPPTRLFVLRNTYVQVQRKFFCVPYSPLRDQCDRCQGEVIRRRLPRYPPPLPPPLICILPTFICLLLALLTIGTYPSFSLLLIDKLTNFDLIIWKVISITRGAINSDQPKAYNTRHKSLKQEPFVFLTFTPDTLVLPQMCPTPFPMLSHAYFGALRRL